MNIDPREKLYINLSFAADIRQSISNRLSDYQVHFGNPEVFEEEDKKKFLESDFMLGWCDPELLVISKNLKWIQLDSVGYGQYQNLNWSRANDLPRMTNLRFLLADFAAETAVAGLLSHFRGIQELVKLQQLGTWDQVGIRKQLKTLMGKKVLIVGMGGIGQAVKSRLSNFKCEISTFGNSLESADFILLDELDDRISETDVLVICLPENSSTIGLFDSARLSKLKNSAVLINVGRGSVLDENMLINMLSTNRMAFAILDVTQQEPLTKVSKLWDLPNVLLTQHTGGGVKDENLLKLDFFFQNLERLRSGLPLINEISIV